MNSKRGRKAIKPSIKRLIFEKALKDKNMPRLALAVELKKQIEEMYEIPPSEETMMKLISKARNQPDSPLDEPWSIESLVQHPIPAESLPLLLEVYALNLKMKVKPLSIRWAIWVVRLSYITKDPFIIWSLVQRYAQEERITEITGEFNDLQSNLFDTLRLYATMTGKVIEVKLPGKDLEKPYINIAGISQKRSKEMQKWLTDLYDRPDEQLEWPYIIDIEDRYKGGKK